MIKKNSTFKDSSTAYFVNLSDYREEQKKGGESKRMVVLKEVLQEQEEWLRGYKEKKKSPTVLMRILYSSIGFAIVMAIATILHLGR